MENKGFHNLRLLRAVAVIATALCSVGFISGCGEAEDSNPVIEQIDEENRLVVYTSHKEEIYAPIVKEFEDRTGIWVDVEYYGTTEFLEKIRSNYGSFTCDVVFGGGIESYNAYTDYFIPYKAEGRDNFKYADASKDDYWTPFSELPAVIIYNDKLVSEEQAPTGWNDLLDEHWKGNIAFANPNNSGSSITILSTLVQIMKGPNKDAIEKFAGQLDGNVLESSQTVTELVAKGTYAIGLTLEENALKAQSEGKDIAIVYPVEGTSAVPDAAAIVNGARHVKNAQLFLDFISGQDVQRILTENMYRRTVRTDVENTVQTDELILSGYDINEATKKRDFIMSTWNSLTETEAVDE